VKRALLLLLLLSLGGSASAGRLFDDASSEYIHSSTQPFTAFPVSVVAWGYVDNTGGNRTLAAVGDAANTNRYAIVVSIGATDWRWQLQEVSGATFTDHTDNPTVNQWTHLIGASAGANDHTVYVDGVETGAPSAATESVTWSQCEHLCVGALRGNATLLPHSGGVGYAAFYASDINPGNAGSLASGANPAHVLPDKLVAFYPLYGTGSTAEPDAVGGHHLTNFNGSTKDGSKPLYVWPAPGGME